MSTQSSSLLEATAATSPGLYFTILWGLDVFAAGARFRLGSYSRGNIKDQDKVSFQPSAERNGLVRLELGTFRRSHLLATSIGCSNERWESCIQRYSNKE